MRKIHTARELYCEILISFYFGVYQKYDKLMTYREMQETYGLAKDTIGAAYDMLRRDGFIRTEGAHGTIVTFDINKPEHVDKVPLEWWKPGEDTSNPYELPLRLHGNTLCMGLNRASIEQLMRYQKLTWDIVQTIEAGNDCYEQVFSLWLEIVSVVDNHILSLITDHFINWYLYFVPSPRLSSEQQARLNDSTREFYEYVLDAVKRQQFDEFTDRFVRYYNAYYQSGGLVFGKLEERALFKEQALYGKLLNELCVTIVTGNLQKGDTLPSTSELCEQYGVSKTTVIRAYGILAEMGVVNRYTSVGTKLSANPGEPGTRGKLEQAAGIRQSDWKDAVEILLLINRTLTGYITIPEDVVHQMRTELDRQKNLFDCYTMPFYVYPVLISPLIMDVPAGIMHKYYSYLLDVLNKTMALFTFQVRGYRELGERMYQLVNEALEALECGNQELFAEKAEYAVRRNVEMLVGEFAIEFKCT